MLKSTKILIIIIIILVGALGVISGMFIMISQKNISNNSSQLQTNNNSTTTIQSENTSSNKESDYISEGEAINIAKTYLNINESYEIRTIFYYAEDDKPALWKIFFYSASNPNKCLGFANVNAITGEII